MSVTVAAPIDLDTLSLDSFRDQPVAVLGLARSGVALTRFLCDRGARVTVYDARHSADLLAQIDQLEGRPVRLLLGPDVDPATALADQALIATSPSINSRYPTTEPRMREALAALEADGRTPVVSEIDLFLRLCPATTIGVTGTKGKTTTSSLIAAVLARGAAPSVLGGNIGIPLVERLPHLTPEHRVVVELSELQLPSLSRGTDVAVYTHVTSDHLDRHGTVEAYRRAKRRLAELLPSSGAIVVNAEDPVSSSFVGASAAPAVYYQRDEPIAGGVGLRGDWIVSDGVAGLDASGGYAGRVMPLGEVQIPGDHNISNVLAAVAVGLLFGIAPDAIRAAIGNFRGVEHRLERVATIDGVTFVNDSQGTQPDAVIAALRAFEPPIVLIAGGRTKNVPLDELAPVVAERAAAAVLIGETAAEMRELFGNAGLARMDRASSLEAAVAQAFAMARELGTPSTVLLSPAATSFDMFTDYEHRGRAFKDAVANLAKDGGGD